MTSQTDWGVLWFFFFLLLRNSFTAEWLKTSSVNTARPSSPEEKALLYCYHSLGAKLKGLLASSGLSEYVCLLSLSSLIKPWPDQRSVPWSETMHSVLSSSVRKQLVTANCNTRLRIELTFVIDLSFLQTTDRIVREAYEIWFSFWSTEVFKTTEDINIIGYCWLPIDWWSYSSTLDHQTLNSWLKLCRLYLENDKGRVCMNHLAFLCLQYLLYIFLYQVTWSQVLVKVFDFLRQHCTLVGTKKFMLKSIQYAIIKSHLEAAINLTWLNIIVWRSNMS